MEMVSGRRSVLGSAEEPWVRGWRMARGSVKTRAERKVRNLVDGWRRCGRSRRKGEGPVVGKEVGSLEGTSVGAAVGSSTGFADGSAVGVPVGRALGFTEGAGDGDPVGTPLGAGVGQPKHLSRRRGRN